MTKTGEGHFPGWKTGENATKTGCNLMFNWSKITLSIYFKKHYILQRYFLPIKEMQSLPFSTLLLQQFQFR